MQSTGLGKGVAALSGSGLRPAVACTSQTSASVSLMLHAPPQAQPAGSRAVKRVVIVDDSRSIRAWLRHVLQQDPRLEVVGEAGDAESARQIIKQTNPDVLTLDVQMPGMSGLAFLERLMALHPMPVVIVSAFANSGSDIAIKALSLGAVDCIVKPGHAGLRVLARDIGRRVFSAACSTYQPMLKRNASRIGAQSDAKTRNGPIVLIGASTGGVTALEIVLSNMATDGPPTVIVQHMPAAFLISFAKLLDRNLPHDVGLLNDRECLYPGQVRLAPEIGCQTELTRRNGLWQGHLRDDAERGLHCPSVDALFCSAAPYGHDVIAVILTGLGRDGTEGMRLLHRSGAHTIGQDAASSVVYGMPKSAWEAGAVNQQMPVEDIGQAIDAAALAHHRRRRVAR